MSSRGTKRKRNSSSKGLDRNKPPTKRRQENVRGSSNSKNFKQENYTIQQKGCKSRHVSNVKTSSRGTKRKRNSSSKGLDRNKPPTKRRQERVRGSSNSKNFKIFNDPVHGQIKVHPLCVKIIDTPQFQRLRYIKQLGLCYLVFPGAAHNRFEHSIGVYHLAGKYCRTLQTQKPKLGIYEKDVLCVQIAGLCHDLGHGPFSHVFDNMFIPKVTKSKWTHEKASLEMFDHLINSNDLKGDFKKYRLTDRDITFIKELIDPPKKQKDLEGRDEDKHFLYDIVANKRNGIDVDKWDYFLRDCHNLGISSSFDCHRFMECSRVIGVYGKKKICARDKEVENLYDMFYTRMSLHRRAYQHKTTKIIEEMLVEALIKANKYLTFKGRDDKDKRMSDAIHDMVAYTKMTDDIIQQIMRSNNKNLKPSQDILKRIERRQLYKYIGKMDPKEKIVKTKITQAIRQGMKEAAPKEDIVISVVTFNYGCKTHNPIDKVRFYTKDNPDKGIKLPKDEVSTMLPEKFQEKQIRVYYKGINEEKIKNAKTCFEKWKELEREKQDNERKANPVLETPKKKK